MHVINAELLNGAQGTLKFILDDSGIIFWSAAAYFSAYSDRIGFVCILGVMGIITLTRGFHIPVRV